MGKQPFSDYIARNAREWYVEYHGEKGSRKVFHHDRAEVTYSRYFRRLAFKQFHISNPGPDNRTRLLHSIEVATIATGMARRLGLQGDLTEAIALGHDVAKAPCGYPADKVLNELLASQGGFDHGVVGAQLLQWGSLKKQGSKRFERLRVIPCYKDQLFKFNDGSEKISTLTDEVLDGIAKHTAPGWDDKYGDSARTVEGQLVRIADNLSYLSQEIDEALSLDENLKERLARYATASVLTNPRTGKEKTGHELSVAPSGCSADPEFRNQIFGERLGPRLMSMIKRVECFNREALRAGVLDLVDSEWCRTGRVPVLRYDPVLEFVIDFLWDDFIGLAVNEHPKVKARSRRNEEIIRKVFDLRNTREPDSEPERSAFEERRREVRHYYPGLKGASVRRRVVAHHIATMVDSQVEELATRT